MGTLYIIGIDGGGTKTEAILFHFGRGEISRIKGEGSNPHSIGFEQSTLIVTSLINQLMSFTNGEDIHIGIGLAGLGREESKKKWTAEFNRHNLKKKVKSFAFESDAIIALYSGTYGGSGIVTIGGTGAICLAFDGKQTQRVGGWGHLINADPGSGYYLGYRALEAIFNEYDGLGPKTEMTYLLLNKLEEVETPGLIKHIYSSGNEKAKIASFAPVVFEAVSKGDYMATRIIDEVTNIITNNGKVVFNKAFDQQNTLIVPFVLIGGIFNNRIMHIKLKQKIEKEISGVQLILPTLPPAYGSIALALKSIGYQSKAIKDVLSKQT
ncbi:BadF/BadG/BcrA/BcrD ATPase family protein [Virgibacillus sp. C22-A2]|uniref:BadF/BadG/BcrA/BcrD ATPase family protein n=1 Tax=Virgibacillus tibetensis TaxID=3042313 RepID=A0ABU6KD01_9BACI|nr:BadF/BadG/BcrA/BcrD ATPase family protein [Virgibacillus sp. C22-A2]